ncbi:family 78 glycoside hydrolase catalytic domain [Enterococcus casseliflavus]|uniref:alpha-L-rhamnosidase n=1 Tax=Enterococcus casseliflavus TaxID=37734 RepID=A0ABD5FGT8_ENTCA|nr:family 78 glycoside hydrolase catalytic domain [Enterococcus casseliflavus]MDT2981262.1 family 78 glycoside hydrolase catalytic domain [Enterococcus casseliflavus]
MDELRKRFITSQRSDYEEGSVSVFSKQFSLKKDPVAAELSITALGIYEAELNGEKLGDQLFAPGYTYYPKDLFYQKFDVLNKLSAGNHELKIYLGQGWYSGRFTHDNLVKIYGDQTAVSWILVVTYEDGSVENYYSDSSVNELQSPYHYAGFYDGEIFDQRIEEICIGKAKLFEGRIPEHLSETHLEVKIQEEIAIKEVVKKEQKTILDFGQNFAGFVEVDLGMLPKGACLKLRHGEMLTKDGALYTDNLRKAKAETVIYANGEMGRYRPRFTYMGFRYVELTGVEYRDGLLTARAIYSEMERTGFFTSSNKKVERLFLNQLWGQKSNYVEIPTDCPQRDERMGYTGDGQAFALTGSYNFNTENFWQKFFKDIRFSQLDNKDGFVAPTIPATGPGEIGFLNMLGWGNAVTIIPEIMYWQYGSSKLQEGYYENMKLFVDSEIRHMQNDLWLAPNLGDWLMPGKDMAWMAMNNGPVSNSFIVNDLNLLSKLARRLGRMKDAADYEIQLKKTREAYIDQFISEDGVISGDYQGAYVMALQYVGITGDLRQKMLKRLVTDVKIHGLNTGFFATEYLLPLLVEAKEVGLAFDVLLNEACPGWMYQVVNGATTIWERWDALKEDGTINDVKIEQSNENMVSFNHYAFGSVGKFFYQYILGIQPLEPGYKRILIRPYTDARISDAAGSYHSTSGEIKSAWKYLSDKQIQFNITTPKPTVIELPNGEKFEVLPGEYEFEVDLSTNKKEER